ncbi:GldG family protein [Treponema zioleckii]|uniref:GldG family protein n=1 Tax=Treponema zioleckii TaxID=331680 RepID=UPI00168BCCD8|nr:GldG family protein [Treponema zioleckii]
MKKFSSFYKSLLYSFLIDPLFYVSSIIVVLFCAFRFYFTSKFFVTDIGSTDLRSFFNAVPYVSVIVIPLLVLRLRPFITEDSLPISSFKRFLALNLAGFSAYAVSLLFLLVIPFSVSFFGDVDFGQLITGYIGLCLYAFTSVSLAIFLFSLLPYSPAIPLFVTVAILTVTNFIHLIPLYIKTNSFLATFMQKISFAWHFDASGKGILDSRNIVYYFLISLVLILLSVAVEYKRLERKINRITVFLFSLSIFFFGFSFSRFYFREDFSESKKFSVSKTSRQIIDNLEEPLRITYFRSKELKDFYPQTSDIAEYLQDYSAVSPNITFTLEKASPERLASLGVQGQQLKNQTGTKTEYITVYSAILIQYLEKQTLIPFIINPQSLEYDLSQRVQELITGQTRNIFVLNGNERSFEFDYSIIEPLLAQRGFHVYLLKDEREMLHILPELSPSDELLILGSSKLSEETCIEIEKAVKRGIPAFITTSPFSIDEKWNITRNTDDNFIPVLKSWGFAFDNSLVQDISSATIKMESNDKNNLQYITLNYPLWVSVLPSSDCIQGATVFWASPITPYGAVKPLLETSSHAWLQKESGSQNVPFLVDPFSIQKTAGEAGQSESKFVLAGIAQEISGYYEPGKSKAKVVVVGDQNFLDYSTTMMISEENRVDSRNFDFLTSQLLKLRGDAEIAELMEKSQPNTTLYKITEEDEFLSARIITIIITFFVIPVIFAAWFIIFQIRRRYR